MLTLEKSRKTMKAYIDEIASIDAEAASGIAYNASKVKRAIQSLARNVGTRAAETTIAVAALGATPKILINNQLNLLGFLFENLVVRDLRIYAQALGGRVMQ